MNRYIRRIPGYRNIFTDYDTPLSMTPLSMTHITMKMSTSWIPYCKMSKPTALRSRPLIAPVRQNEGARRLRRWRNFAPHIFMMSAPFLLLLQASLTHGTAPHENLLDVMNRSTCRSPSRTAAQLSQMMTCSYPYSLECALRRPLSEQGIGRPHYHHLRAGQDEDPDSPGPHHWCGIDRRCLCRLRARRGDIVRRPSGPRDRAGD